jgi:peptidoglycan/LPS O-acetylase OafA/YrhL
VPPLHKHIPQLDLLRGIAVIAVMLCHYPCFQIFSVGSAGVDLFFVLSGFLISSLLFSEWKQTGRISIFRFYVRRGFKIYPSFYFLIATSPGLFLVVPEIQSHPLSRLAAEIFFLQDYLPHIWGHTWSLAVEEQFYLLLPLLLTLMTKLHNPARPFSSIPLLSGLACIGCLAFRVAQNPISALDVRFAFHFRADALFAGVALGYLFHFRNRVFCAVSSRWLVPVSIGALLPQLLCPETAALAPYVLGCNTVAFTFLVWWSVSKSNLRSPLLERVGTYSYSIYLWHFPMAEVFNRSHPHLLLLPFYILASIKFGTYMGNIVEWRALAVRDRRFPAITAPSVSPAALEHAQ